MKISLICNCLLMGIFSGMIVAGPVTKSAPKGERWHQPCQGGTPARLGHHIMTDYAHYRGMVYMSKDAGRVAKSLTKKYEYEVFENPGFVNEVKTMHVGGMPEVKEFNPLLEVEPATADRDAIDSFARAAVFLEHSRKQEPYYTIFQTDLETLEEKTYDILCELQVYLQADDMASTVHSSIIPSGWTSMRSEAERKTRDFLIVRDLNSVLDYTDKVFTDLFDKHKP